MGEARASEPLQCPRRAGGLGRRGRYGIKGGCAPSRVCCLFSAPHRAGRRLGPYLPPPALVCRPAAVVTQAQVLRSGEGAEASHSPATPSRFSTVDTRGASLSAWAPPNAHARYPRPAPIWGSRIGRVGSRGRTVRTSGPAGSIRDDRAWCLSRGPLGQGKPQGRARPRREGAAGSCAWGFGTTRGSLEFPCPLRRGAVERALLLRAPMWETPGRGRVWPATFP